MINFIDDVISTNNVDYSISNLVVSAGNHLIQSISGFNSMMSFDFDKLLNIEFNIQESTVKSLNIESYIPQESATSFVLMSL